MSFTFLEDLAEKSLPQARKDLDELRAFADEYNMALRTCNPGIWAIILKKMRQYYYQLSQEEVKAYFPVTHVLPGLFAIVEKLYGWRYYGN